MDIHAMVEKYIALRDRKATLKAEYEAKVAPIDAILEKVEVKMQEFFTESGSESVKTSAGTAYKALRTSATVADAETYFGWVGQDFDTRQVFLEKRVNKTAVEEYSKEHGDLPPGINVFRQFVVNIRRS